MFEQRETSVRELLSILLFTIRMSRINGGKTDNIFKDNITNSAVKSSNFDI